MPKGTPRTGAAQVPNATEVNTVFGWILVLGALVFAKYVAKLVAVRF